MRTEINKKDRWDSGKPRRQQYPNIASKSHEVVTLHAFTIHRRLIRPLGLLYGYLYIFSYLLPLGKIFGPPTATLTPERFFLKSNNFFLGSEGRVVSNWKWICQIVFEIFCTQRFTQSESNFNQERPLGQRKTPPPTNTLLSHLNSMQ